MASPHFWPRAPVMLHPRVGPGMTLAALTSMAEAAQAAWQASKARRASRVRVSVAAGVSEPYPSVCHETSTLITPLHHNYQLLPPHPSPPAPNRRRPPSPARRQRQPRHRARRPFFTSNTLQAPLTLPAARSLSLSSAVSSPRPSPLARSSPSPRLSVPRGPTRTERRTRLRPEGGSRTR